MKELAMIGCVIAVAACGATGKANRDSGAADTSIVAGPPAFQPAPVETVSAPLPAARNSPSGGTRAKAAEVKPPTTSGVVPPRPMAASVRPDSVRGIVSVVGTQFEKRVTIASPAGGKRTEVTGPLASLIGHVAGAEVSVVGTPTGTTLVATSFLVRTVDGAAAIDGTLRTEGSTLYIVTANGTRTRITTPPPPLLGHDGARVWITGDPAKGVSSFGFIDPPR